jgi:hypothetical protein
MTKDELSPFAKYLGVSSTWLHGLNLRETVPKKISVLN